MNEPFHRAAPSDSRINAKLAIGGIMLGFLLLAVFIVPPVYRIKPNDIDLTAIEQPPSRQHPLGTDALGRDVLARIAAGGTVSLVVGIAATAIRTLIAVLLGFTAAFSKKADAVIMRLIDVQLCFPFYVLALSIMVFLGHSVTHLIIVIACFTFAPSARLLRTEVRALKELEFIQICRINGESSLRILCRHILPLVKHTLAVICTTSVAQAVLMESSLSFLGMGIQEPQASWGSMLSTALDMMNLGTKWFLWMPAGLCIVLLTYSIHLIGEGINELSGR